MLLPPLAGQEVHVRHARRRPFESCADLWRFLGWEPLSNSPFGGDPGMAWAAGRTILGWGRGIIVAMETNPYSAVAANLSHSEVE